MSGLVLNLNPVEQPSITNGDPAFVGTRYARSEFQIWYQKLTRSQEFMIVKKHTKVKKRGKEEVNTPAVERDKFCAQVQRWEGILDAGGKEIPCTNENKGIIAEHNSEFANLIHLAIFNVETAILDEDDEGDGNPINDAREGDESTAVGNSVRPGNGD